MFGVKDTYAWVLIFLRMGFRASYVWGLVFFTFGGQ